MNFLRKWKDFFVCLFLYYRKVFIAEIVFGVVCYSMLIQNHLTNSVDGVWEGSFYQSGKWQISLGRFATLYADKVRFGIQTDPINSILTLFLFSLGLFLILDIFEERRWYVSFIFGGIYISSLVVGVSLSYRFMSPIFALAFFFACLASYILEKEDKYRKISLVLSGMMIAVSMGMYQAAISVYTIIFLCLGIQKWMKDGNIKKEIDYFLRGIIALLMGGAAYFLCVRLHQIIFHVDQSAYNGGNQYGIMNSLEKLGCRFNDAYVYFKMYFGSNLYTTNYLQHFFPFFYIVLGFMFIVIFIKFVKTSMNRCRGHRFIISTLFLLLMLWLIPPACFAVSFLATDTGVSVQMVGAYCLLPGLLFLLSINQTKRKLLKLAIFVIGGTLIYGQVYQCQVDQQAMLSGRNASYQIAERIMDEIIDEDLYCEEYTYCILGTAAECQMFCPEELYGKANYYAMFGCWWKDNSDKSWRGIYEELGMKLPIGGADMNALLEKEEQYREMPCFPQKGSVELSENYEKIVIIKLR